MSLPNAATSFQKALFAIGNTALVAVGQTPMTDEAELLSTLAEPYPSIHASPHQGLGLEASVMMQTDARIPAILDEWTHLTFLQAMTDGLDFKPGRQTPGRAYIDLLNYQISDNPSAPSGKLRLELVGSRVWRPGWDGLDIRLYTCVLNIFYT